MEAYLNDKEDDFFDNNHKIVWSENPLYNNNNKIDVSDCSNSLIKNTVSLNNNLRHSPRTNVEYETESGYSETVYSELSSPNHSFSSNISYSDADEECDLLSGIIDGMRKANLVICSGSEREALKDNSDSSQIISSRGTVRGVKNRVRDNVLHFLSSPSKVNDKDEDVEVSLS